MGSAVIERGFLYKNFEIKFAKEQGKKWYRSKDKKGGEHPFTSDMLNKKWTLEEEFNNHILRFQQVTVGKHLNFSELHFDIPGWIGGR